MNKPEQPIIIKRIKKAGHGGHHGGSWKVAYADFVTAMMAFFLVMWLISVLSIESKKAVAEYFRSFTIFESVKAGGAGGKDIGPLGSDPIKIEKEPGGISPRRDIHVRVAKEIGAVIEQNLKAEQKDQILITAAEYGIRIEMVEKTGSPMFESGKATLLPAGKEIISAVSEAAKNTSNDIIIEGHTDAYSYQKEGYTNWELAADRANAVRRELINNGIATSRIKQVASFADKLPIKADDPYAPINRRVSILLLDRKKDRLIGETIP